MNPNLIFMLVALIGFAAVAGVGLVFTGGQNASPRSHKRLAAVAGGSRADRAARAGPRGQEAAVVRRKQMLQTLKANEKQSRRAKLTLDSRLQQAGLAWSVRTFWIVSAGLGGGVFVVLAVLSHNPLIALGAGFGAGAGLPRWWMGFRCKGRHKKFTEEFPNAIDIIVRGIKSGLPVHDCLKVIAAETPEPVCGEFRRLVENLGMSVTLDQAMEKMYVRMPTAEVRFFSIVLAIQAKSGGNLAEALGNLSIVLRARKLMGEKIKAMSGEAVASAAIIGSLPPGIMVMVTLTTPSYMARLYFTPGGHLALLVGATMMAMGIFVMRRMISFKF